MLPRWTELPDGTKVCIDDHTGKELLRRKCPLLPNGSQMQIFTESCTNCIDEALPPDRWPCSKCVEYSNWRHK